MLKQILFALLIISANVVHAKTDMPKNVSEYTLDNGLKIIVKEDHRAPVVISQIWYKVGSSFEPRGITGIAHMLEHMMFKGTKDIPKEAIDALVYETGGYQNAMTSYDFTTYFQKLDAKELEISFKIESDRMRNLLFDEAEFVKERDVVAEERRLRTENNPERQLIERFLAVSQPGSSYSHPVIGWMQDIQAYKLENVKNWYQKYYAPNNAVLVVVGAVDPKNVYQLATKYFGGIKQSTIPKHKIYKMWDNVGTRRLDVVLATKVPELVIGFNVPSLNSAQSSYESYALDLIANILATGNASRLQKDVVREKKIASMVDASYYRQMADDTLFFINAIPTSGASLEQLEHGLLVQIDALSNVQITEAELERAKIQAISKYVYDKDSLLNQAMEIGSMEAIGRAWIEEHFVQNIQAVTAQEIQAVAKKYLQPNSMTIARMNVEKNA